MRHRKGNKKLGRTTAHRILMLRNLITSLIVHERIKTTKAKAKAAKPIVEKLITLAREDSVAARRSAFSALPNRVETQNEKGLSRMTHVINKLFNELGPRYKTRPGGYTRILLYPKPRLGDAGEQVIFELVRDEDVVAEPKKTKKKPAKATPKKKAKKAVAAPVEKAVAEEPSKPVVAEEAAPKDDSAEE